MMDNKEMLLPGQEKDFPHGQVVQVGLSWVFFGQNFDLDITAVRFTNFGQLIDAAYFNKPKTDDQCIIHSGDERTGKSEGYDEKISIYLDRVPASTKVIAILVNSNSGVTFSKIEVAELTITIDGNAVISINCGSQGNHLSILAAFIFRPYDNNPSIWKIKSICQVGNHKTFVESIPNILSNMSFLVSEELIKESEAWNVKSSKSFNLIKNDEVYIASCLNEIAMGLGWDTKCDIDSSVITMDQNFNILEYIYYGNRCSNNGSIKHSGDDTTGEGKGDDENIIINLNKVNPNVCYIGCLINVYTQNKTFIEVKGAYCRLLDWRSKAEFCAYRLTESGPNRSCLMCYVKRDMICNKWKIKAVGAFFPVFDQKQLGEFIKLDILQGGTYFRTPELAVPSNQVVIQNTQMNNQYNGSNNLQRPQKNKKDDNCCNIL